MPGLEHILCPVDFSEGSERAVQYAVDLAKSLNATVSLLHVYETPMQWVPAGIAYTAEEPGAVFDFARLKDALRVKLEQLRSRAAQSGVTVHAHLAQGAPAHGIVEQAADLGASLIVMSTHGRRGLDHLLLGSVAERVLRLAKCPVLTVRLTASA
jgi:universal stress protein A